MKDKPTKVVQVGGNWQISQELKRERSVEQLLK